MSCIVRCMTSVKTIEEAKSAMEELGMTSIRAGSDHVYGTVGRGWLTARLVGDGVELSYDADYELSDVLCGSHYGKLASMHGPKIGTDILAGLFKQAATARASKTMLRKMGYQPKEAVDYNKGEVRVFADY